MGGSGSALRFRNPDTGASFSFGLPLPPGVDYQVRVGNLLPDDGSEVHAEAPADGSVPRPRRNGAHEAWIRYAVDQGMPRDVAGSLTRAELIARTSEVAFDPAAAPEGDD